jgi:hypothetical protein
MKIDPLLDDATGKLLHQLHTGPHAEPRFKNVQHLLTRLSDKRGHGKGDDLVEIVFDSPVMDTDNPEVVVYRVTAKDCLPCLKKVYAVKMADEVNRIVGTYKQINAEHGQSSSSRTIDVREQTRIKRGLINTAK